MVAISRSCLHAKRSQLLTIFGGTSARIECPFDDVVSLRESPWVIAHLDRPVWVNLQDSATWPELEVEEPGTCED